MKFRADFVTNSSSSSFITIKFKCKIIETYMQENGIMEDLFEDIGWYYEERTISFNIEKSFAQSLINYLKAAIADCQYEFEDEDQIDNLIQFIDENKSEIDAQISGAFSMDACLGEDGFGYSQSLTYKKHHGKLVKWPPFEKGFTDEYEDIRKYNRKFFNNEIDELKELRSSTIYEVVADDKQLKKAIQLTGLISEFEV